jgi:RsiW-degrading membrane proteinase PrsW (M82 family)
MRFTLLQIGVTYLSLFTTIGIALLWNKQDKKSKNTKNHESFTVLMSVFFWATVLSTLFLMLIHLIITLFPSIQTFSFTSWSFPLSFLEVMTVTGEETVKIIALIIGLDIAGKLFNELSDGIIYTAFAVLGFVFFENSLFLFSANGTTEFITIFFQRNLFSYSAHLSTIFFGLCYAQAYLNTSPDLLEKLKSRNEHRIKPYHIHKMIRFLFQKYRLLTPFFFLFAPGILVFKIFQGKKTHITMSELFIGGYISSISLHLLYNALLTLNIPILNTLTLFLFGSIGFTLLYFFPKISVE